MKIDIKVSKRNAHPYQNMRSLESVNENQ